MWLLTDKKMKYNCYFPEYALYFYHHGTKSCTPRLLSSRDIQMYNPTHPFNNLLILTSPAYSMTNPPYRCFVPSRNRFQRYPWACFVNGTPYRCFVISICQVVWHRWACLAVFFISIGGVSPACNFLIFRINKYFWRYRSYLLKKQKTSIIKGPVYLL